MKDSKYIVSIGTVCIDDYVKSPHWPKLGDKTLAEFKGYEVGGMPYNAACVVSSTGIKTYMLDVIGREFRDIIIEDIDENNIDKSLITYDDHKTMRTIIVNSQGERVIFVLDEDKKPEINLTGDQVDILSKADYLYSNIPEVNRIIKGKNIIEDLRKKGVKIFYDVEKTMLKDEYNIEFFMENADYISFNVEGYKELVKIKSQDFIDKLIDMDTKIIITKGKNGCKFLSKDTIIELEGIERKTLDTTGAGDTFNGILISSLIKGAKHKEALIKANEIASLSTEYYGVNKKIGKLLK